MRLIDFLKERIIFISINMLIILFSAFTLMVFKVDLDLIIFFSVINIISSLSFHLYDYIKRRNYYKGLIENLESLDKKYLISDLIEDPTFIDGIILKEVLYFANKSMNDEIGKLRNSMTEYEEYINIWVHEIKTPIATTKLIIENNKNDITKSIDEEINKIDNYIEQALYYAKSSYSNDDYIIKKINLKEVVNRVIRKNARSLIAKKIKITLENLEEVIYSDSKWIEFIINQIIINSIKYMNKDEKEILISSYKVGENIVLKIKDDGCGISEKDINKIFDKGFTGENGRKFTKSTGIGLFLCKKLCENLGLSIKVDSKINVGTVIYIVFPINNMQIF